MQLKRRLEQKTHQRHEQDLSGKQERDDAKQLSDVDRRPICRGHQQRAQRLRLPFALERASESECSGKRNRDPEDAGGAIFRRLSFLDQREGKEQHARDGKEERRVGDLEAAHLDRQIFFEHEPRNANHARVPMIDRYVERSASGLATASSMRPSRRNSASSSRPSARSRSCVARMTMAPSSRKPRSRATSAAVDASPSPVNGSSGSTRRGAWISERSSATRWRMPREKLEIGS